MKLLLMNDPALRKVCDPVGLDELEHINSLVPQMMDLLNQKEGLALAANQVGIIKRFFVMKDGTVIINPSIIEMGTVSPFDEGCLSIPGTYATTQRAKYVKLSYKDRSFVDVEVEYSGIDAVAVQHEIDHLDGKLYIDGLPPMRRQLVLDKHRKHINKLRRR